MRLIAFVTHRGLPDLAQDDRLAIAPLAERGIRVEAAAWDDDEEDWTRFDALVLRSTWNYHKRLGHFEAWLDRTEAGPAPLWNPAGVVRWNARKHYLRDLAVAGIRVVPTCWIEADGDHVPALGGVLEAEGWTEAVIKPTVSGGAYDTWRVRRPVSGADEARFAGARRRGGVMVQRFVPEVTIDGEWSLCFVGGAFSHAVLKRPHARDFRVQEEFGGTTAAATPPDFLVPAAAQALAAAPGPWLYARVDGCVTRHGLVVTELEMIEPSLFLDRSPGAPARFADAIARAVGAEPERSR
jgi:hypothetical protein